MKVRNFVQLELDIVWTLKVEVIAFAFLKKIAKLMFMFFQANQSLQS